MRYVVIKITGNLFLLLGILRMSKVRGKLFLIIRVKYNNVLKSVGEKGAP